MVTTISLPSSGGFNPTSLADAYYRKGVVVLEGEINNESALAVIGQLTHLGLREDQEPVILLINSPGGEIKAGMMIYDALQSTKLNVTVVCVGRAYSMGAVLLASGINGRYILENSDAMLHEPLVASGIGGNATSIKALSDSLLEARSKMNRLLAKHLHKTEDEIQEACKEDHFFSSAEAVDFGIADQVISFDELLELIETGKIEGGC